MQAPYGVHLAAAPFLSRVPARRQAGEGAALGSPAPGRRPRAVPLPELPAARPSILATRPRGIFFSLS